MQDFTRCSFTAAGFDREQLDNLINVLRETGFTVSSEYAPSDKSAKVSFRGLPEVCDARVRRTRRAGRRPNRICPPHGSLFDGETEIREFLAWLDGGHGPDEGMAQLGLARSTYFRKLKRMREAAAEDERRNARWATIPAMRDTPPVYTKLWEI